jgi:homoserine O-acetyltransferase/O-succinyltransferase
MVGHITYMSDSSMFEKFGRQLKDDKQPFKFTADFEVEGYLQNRGDNFVKRFDANSYLYITKAMDYFDVSAGKPLYEVLRGITAQILVIAFGSDWLYPAYQSQEIVRACKMAGINATYCEIASTYGHDAFLVEIEEESHLVKHFLKKVLNGYEAVSEYEI